MGLRYSRIELKNGEVRYRSRPTNPATGHRISLEASTLKELRERVNRVREVRDELKWGGITRKQAAERLRPAITGSDMTVDAIWRRYLPTVPEGSRRIVEGHWKNRLQSLGPLAIDELTREVMTNWERKLQERGYASTTIHGAYDHLASAVRLAVDGGVIDGIPWGDVPRSQGGTGYRPAAPKSKERGCAGTVDQVMSLVMVAREADVRAATRCRYSGLAARVLFMILTGLRQAEACAVAWSSVEIDRAPYLLRVDRQAKAQWHKRKGATDAPNQPTKTRVSRTQVLHENVVLALRAHRAELQRRGWYRLDGPIFPGDAGEWRTSGKLIKPERVRELVALAGIGAAEKWVTHSFRHSFSTLEVVASGGDLRATQARTGHASLKQLEGYLHAAGGHLGRSALPVLPLETASVLPGLPPGIEISRTVDLDPWGFEQIEAAPDLAEADLSEARRFEHSRAIEKRELREQSERTFREIATEWLTRAGNGGMRGKPKAISEAEKRAYGRAYMRGMRAKLSIEECKKAGRRARVATEGAWRKQLSAVQRQMTKALELPRLTEGSTAGNTEGS